jgi:hypothetical protein
MSLTKATYSMISGATVNVFDFMTPAMIADVQARTGLVDTTAAIQAAIDSLSSGGGVVRLPKGKYKTTAELLIPINGISLVGDGQFGTNTIYDQGSTTIYGVHSGNSIVNIKGSIGTTLSNLCLQSGPTSGAYPKSALILGRTSPASSAFHKFISLAVYGNYSVAAIYSIASEVNYWLDLNVWLYGGGAKYCFYTSERDDLNLGPLTQSTNLDNVFVNTTLTSSVTDANAACVYINCGQATGSWVFFGGYLTPAGGSYVEIASGFIDGLPALGPFVFNGFSGERFSGSDPLYGFKLTTDTTIDLPGLVIDAIRFDFLGGSNHFQIYKAPDLTLVAPNIVIQPPEAFPYAQTGLFLQKVKGGVYSAGRDYSWTNVTFESAWSNSLGSPYAPAGYNIDSNGFVRLRGLVKRSAAGSTIMFYLPANLFPPYDYIFSAGVGTGVGQILVRSSDGAVSLLTGTVTDGVNLSSVQFNCH